MNKSIFQSKFYTPFQKDMHSPKLNVCVCVYLILHEIFYFSNIKQHSL